MSIKSKEWLLRATIACDFCGVTGVVTVVEGDSALPPGWDHFGSPVNHPNWPLDPRPRGYHFHSVHCAVAWFGSFIRENYGHNATVDSLPIRGIE